MPVRIRKREGEKESSLGMTASFLFWVWLQARRKRVAKESNLLSICYLVGHAPSLCSMSSDDDGSTAWLPPTPVCGPFWWFSSEI